MLAVHEICSLLPVAPHPCGEKIAVKIGLKLQILIDLALRHPTHRISVDFGVRALIPTFAFRQISWLLGGRGAPARITENRTIPV
jgi:hypothetical protein